jgi:asparagine synthase (glutamine-hydrolysing)
MYHGLEVRPPILDKKFFSLCASIPAEKLYTWEHQGRRYSGKIPLKNLLARKMGHAFAHRSKQGFVMPLEKWLSDDRKKSQVCDRLLGSRAHITNWFEPEKIRKVIDGKSGFNTWLLMVLEEWLFQVLNENSSENLSRPEPIWRT